VVKGKDFLSLSFEDLVKVISCNDIAVPFEEKVSITTTIGNLYFNILYGKSTYKSWASGYRYALQL